MLGHMSNHVRGEYSVQRENVAASETRKNLFGRMQGCSFTGVRQTKWPEASLAPQFVPCRFPTQLTLQSIVSPNVWQQAAVLDCAYYFAGVHARRFHRLGGIYASKFGTTARLAYNLICRYILLHETATNLDRRSCKSRGRLRLE